MIIGDMPSFVPGPGPVTYSPALGTGWEKVFYPHQAVMTRRLMVLGIRLPLRQHIPYQNVVKVSNFCRLSRFGGAGAPLNPWATLAVWGIYSPSSRNEMPSKGWLWDVDLILDDGRKVKVTTVKTPQAAAELVSALEAEIFRKPGGADRYSSPGRTQTF